MEKLYRILVIHGLLASALVFLPSQTVADNLKPAISLGDSQTHSSLIDLITDEGNKALKARSVSFLIGFGPFEGAQSPYVLGDKLKNLSAEAGDDAASFVVFDKEKPGFTVAATNGIESTGFMTPQEMYSRIPNLIEKTRRLHRKPNYVSGVYGKD